MCLIWAPCKLYVAKTRYSGDIHTEIRNGTTAPSRGGPGGLSVGRFLQPYSSLLQASHSAIASQLHTLTNTVQLLTTLGFSVSQDEPMSISQIFDGFRFVPA